jgi:hypothetical protein
MRVALVVTGQLEHRALAAALTRLFPEHEFVVEPDHRPLDGFTSTRLPSPRKGYASNLDKLIQQLTASIDPPERRAPKPADYVVLLDDLELANVDQVDVVLDEVRQAVDRHLTTLATRYNEAKMKRVRARLCERASFHLAAPMVESWLFADPDALKRAGVANPEVVCLADSNTLEAFHTADPAFAADDACHCALWHTFSPRKQKQHRPSWLVEDREQHPKAYLAWLCRDPSIKKCTAYRESHEGAAALRDLDWSTVQTTDRGLPFLHALLADLADMLGAPLSLAGVVAPETAHGSGQTLRNL